MISVASARNEFDSTGTRVATRGARTAFSCLLVAPLLAGCGGEGGGNGGGEELAAPNVHREIEGNGATGLGPGGPVFVDGRLWLDWD